MKEKGGGGMNGFPSVSGFQISLGGDRHINNLTMMLPQLEQRENQPICHDAGEVWIGWQRPWERTSIAAPQYKGDVMGFFLYLTSSNQPQRTHVWYLNILGLTGTIIHNVDPTFFWAVVAALAGVIKSRSRLDTRRVGWPVPLFPRVLCTSRSSCIVVPLRVARCQSVSGASRFALSQSI
ncbi:hypothetical protein P175DRAFT_0187934 [Aspergillus ochraceoroseus IBT 24754]|uniref:Uncharacterized protein n=1 Tax=Aspergillus ochraceoroseus IBT 24754 TaxID=1392256 RepID=A0A2T5LYY2_9EURO|nr:uncharacterized protein P175DRAFT_0187934 [Aspergillus ochraceoroseus IBT 24754]PTU21498.1 hypothetical protein P175DRAFT_0187934 [Aspergillus ochraceoroseus IBT 24754]